MIGSLPVCRLSEVVEGALLSVEICRDNLMVSRAADGGIKLVNAHCPHVGTHLGKGSTFTGGVVRCPLHHFKFSLEDGSCQDQKKLRLKFYRASVRDGLVWVDKEADFVEVDASDSAPVNAQAPAVATCAFELEGPTYTGLLRHFARGGDCVQGLRVESPVNAFTHLQVHLAPVDEKRVRVFVVAFLAAQVQFLGRLDVLDRFRPARQAVGFLLETWLKEPVLGALSVLSQRSDPGGRDLLPLAHSNPGEDRYQPVRTFINDWMFVGFARDVGARPTSVERMGRHVTLKRQADGDIQVTSADGSYRYHSKIDPNYGVVMAYFNADYAPPPWTIPDFAFDPDDEVFASYTNSFNCAAEDVHGTVLDWTHLTGYHVYDKSVLTSKFVSDYSIGCTYVTAGKKFLMWKLGDIENINRVTIHGLCTLDFSFTGYFDKEDAPKRTSFDLRLLSMIYLSGGQKHELLINSWKKSLTNASPWFDRLVYPPFKRFSYEVAKLDLVTETRAIYNYKRLLREPQVVSKFPYISLYDYARKFYPETRPAPRVRPPTLSAEAAQPLAE